MTKGHHRELLPNATGPHMGSVENPVLFWSPVPAWALHEGPVRVLGDPGRRMRVVLILNPAETNWHDPREVRAVARELAEVAPTITLDMLGTDALPASRRPWHPEDDLWDLTLTQTFQPTSVHGARLQVVLLGARTPVSDFETEMESWLTGREARRVERAEREDAERHARLVAARARSWAHQHGIDPDGASPAVLSQPDRVRVRIDVLELLTTTIEEKSR